MTAMNDYPGKKFLATVRSGDYAHAGEEEAIELVLMGLQKNPSQKILDVGAGRGGTAAYIQENGWGKVVGVDIESESIAYAKEKYPAVEFQVLDACDVGVAFPAQFDVIILFNVFYAINQKQKAMTSFRQAAKPGAMLLLFDYFSYDSSQFPKEILSSSPSTLKEFETMFESAAWKVEKELDLDQDYIRWYCEFLARFDKPELKKAYDDNVINDVRVKYQALLNSLENKVLGGRLYVAIAA